MANQQMRWEAYQEALSIVKAHAHFGDFGGPSTTPKHLFKKVYEKILCAKDNKALPSL